MQFSLNIINERVLKKYIFPIYIVCVAALFEYILVAKKETGQKYRLAAIYCFNEIFERIDRISGTFSENNNQIRE